MTKRTYRRLMTTGFIALCSAVVMAQHKVEMLPFGDMDQWVNREIKESAIIGGNTKNVYAVGPTQTIAGSKAYTNLGGSPWATSNVMAKVAGVTKTNTSVFPEKRGSGYCALSGNSYGKCESVRTRGYYGTCCRFYVSGHGT